MLRRYLIFPLSTICETHIYNNNNNNLSSSYHYNNNNNNNNNYNYYSIRNYSQSCKLHTPHKGDWQPRPKQKLRYSKSALLQTRARYQMQRNRNEIRQYINETHGQQQQQLSQLRRVYGRTAEELITRSNKTNKTNNSNINNNNNINNSAEAMAAARHLLMLQEATRKEMKGGKRGRKAIFSLHKKWNG